MSDMGSGARSNGWWIGILLALGLALAACTSSGGSGGTSDETLAAPAVTATAGKGRMVLQWDDVPGADSYTLTFSNAPGGKPAGSGLAISGTVERVTSPYEHRYLVYGQTYHYVVTPKGSGGDGLPSDEVSATPARLPLVEIEFADLNMEDCVLYSILADQENDGAEFADQIDTLTRFGDGNPGGCWSEFTLDISGIEWLTGLLELNLSFDALTDVSALSPLIQLEMLDLRYNEISIGVRKLATLTRADTIRLGNNQFDLPCTDLQFLLNVLGAEVISPTAATPVTNCVGGS